MKRTVKTLGVELDKLKEKSGNTKIALITAWHWEQVAVELEKHNRYGELVKFEVTPNARDGYNLIIWHFPLLNKKLRGKIECKGYYAALEKTKDKLK